MDGYAVLASDIAPASEESPVTLTVVDDVPAGYRADVDVTTGNAVRIMTGAPMPPGADAVVMREHVDESDPDEVVIVREENRHAAFGLGIHRCLGSNLARLELRVAIEEFVKRFPHFELAGDTDQTEWSVGQIRGPRKLPVRILETA